MHSCKTFEDLKVSHELKKAIADMGFEEPTPIQAQAIPVALQGKDIIGQAQTGTGKTVAFAIPLVEKVNPKQKVPQALVLCPTRELAIQIAEEFARLTRYKRDIHAVPIYGGQAIDRQLYMLRRGIQVVIGTPGRIMDHMERGTLQLDQISMVVLDEADKMLDMGFRDDIEFILKRTPEERQTLLFSATMPRPIVEMARRYQKNPEMIRVIPEQLTVPSIEQFYCEVNASMKLEALCRIIDVHGIKRALIFCNTKQNVDELARHLQARGYLVESLHGDMTQVRRDRVMEKFRNGKLELLVATDVAARGIDVENLEAVFNYDFPKDNEYYVHRIGRTGRAGKSGRAFSFIVGKEIYKLRDIQRDTKTKIIQKPVPSLREVEDMRSNILFDKIRDILQAGRLERHVRQVEEFLGTTYTSLDVAAALLKMLTDGATDNQAEDALGLCDTGASEGVVRLFMNAGKSARISVRDILEALQANSSVPKESIGVIRIYDKYTFIDIAKEYAKDVLLTMKNSSIRGVRINVELAKPKRSAS